MNKATVFVISNVDYLTFPFKSKYFLTYFENGTPVIFFNQINIHKQVTNNQKRTFVFINPYIYQNVVKETHIKVYVPFRPAFLNRRVKKRAVE